jgi:hypothetical protein
MVQYQALVERHPRLKGEFDWSRAAAGFYGVIRVPATKSFEASLAIYPQSHLTWTGTDALSTFDMRTNEIAVARLRPASPPVVPEDLSLANRISRKLIPEIYSFLAPADSANFVWTSSVISAFALARGGAGVFGATKAQLAYLEGAGVFGAIEPARMDEIVITRILIASTAYQHGQALEEFSLENPDSARGWLPGGSKLARASGEILEAAREFGVEEDISELVEKFRSLNSPDYSLVATSPRQYEAGKTDVILSEFAIGFLQPRILRRIAGGSDSLHNAEQIQARLVFQRSFMNGEACNLLPPLNGAEGEPSPALTKMVADCVKYVGSPEFIREWEFVSSVIQR